MGKEWTSTETRDGWCRGCGKQCGATAGLNTGSKEAYGWRADRVLQQKYSVKRVVD